MNDPARYKGEIVTALARSLSSTDSGLKAVPGLIKRVITEDLWGDYAEGGHGRIVHYETFNEFVEKGLLADVRTLKNLCRDDTEALDLLDEKVQNPVGTNVPLDNIQAHAPTGTSAAASLRRLRKKRPDLHEKVIKGELSPHAAMVTAGFRVKTITVPLDVAKARTVLLKHFSVEELHRIAHG